MSIEANRALVRGYDDVLNTGRRPADFRGVPLARAGLPIDTALAHVFRVEAGLIREAWSLRDELDMARQLGLGFAPDARAEIKPPC